MEESVEFHGQQQGEVLNMMDNTSEESVEFDKQQKGRKC